MHQYLEKTIAELPVYLGNFTSYLTAPRQLINQHLQAEDAKSLFEKSIGFFILSFIVALVLSVIFPEVTNPVNLTSDEASMSKHALASIRLLFELLGLSAMAYLSARLVGLNTGFMRFFGIASCAFGVMLVLQVFASALTNISMADPVTAKTFIELETISQGMKADVENQLCYTDPQTGELKPNPNAGAKKQASLDQSKLLYLKAIDRPLYKFAALLQLLVTLVIFLWGARLWFLYLKTHHLSITQCTIATVSFVVLGAMAWLILGLVDAGTMMMEIYKKC